MIQAGKTSISLSDTFRKFACTQRYNSRFNLGGWGTWLLATGTPRAVMRE